MGNSNSASVGSFVPTNYIWDVAQLESVDVNSPEFKELLVRLYQNINTICLVLNTKDSGYYDTNEFVNGQLYYPNPAFNSQTSPSVVANYRQVMRKVVNFGTLPNATTKSVAHNITVTAATIWTRIYAESTDPVGLTGIPIPYASATSTDVIELNVDSANVNITTGSNRTNYTITQVVLEYLQN